MGAVAPQENVMSEYDDFVEVLESYEDYLSSEEWDSRSQSALCPLGSLRGQIYAHFLSAHRFLRPDFALIFQGALQAPRI